MIISPTHLHNDILTVLFLHHHVIITGNIFPEPGPSVTRAYSLHGPLLKLDQLRSGSSQHLYRTLTTRYKSTHNLRGGPAVIRIWKASRVIACHKVVTWQWSCRFFIKIITRCCPTPECQPHHVVWRRSFGSRDFVVVLTLPCTVTDRNSSGRWWIYPLQ